MWNKLSDRSPEDDAMVFVVNDRVAMLPTKALYCSETNTFTYFEGSSMGVVPIDVTHWMPMIKGPNEPR